MDSFFSSLPSLSSFDFVGGGFLPQKIVENGEIDWHFQVQLRPVETAIAVT